MMKITNSFKEKISNCVVRIIAEEISINWTIPYTLEMPQRGQGTGFFINKKGHILTCSHVVDSAENIYIEIPVLGSNKYKCTLISIIPDYDIALLQCIDYKNTEFLELGDSDKLKLNETVHVVGYPASLTTSSKNSNNIKFTEGVISGHQGGLIQTDSAINPGNSGGPLFYKNKVIGINSSKLVGDELENIGHSVPINYYKIIEKEIDQKIIHRPKWLFDFNNTDKNVILGLTNNAIDHGIMVYKIYDKSPFENTNIKKDTIISEINGFIIDNYGMISNYKWIGTNINIDTLIKRFKNNEIISVKYFNHGKEENCNIKLKSSIYQTRMMYPLFEKINYFIIGGIIFMNFCENHISGTNSFNILCKMINTEQKLIPRVIVTFIFPNTKVNLLNNIIMNDFITKVNDIEIQNINDLKKAVEKPIIINNIKYIKIEEEKGKSVLLNLKNILQEDIEFSKIYKFPLNEFHKQYMKN